MNDKPISLKYDVPVDDDDCDQEMTEAGTYYDGQKTEAATTDSNEILFAHTHSGTRKCLCSGVRSCERKLGRFPGVGAGANQDLVHLTVPVKPGGGASAHRNGSHLYYVR